ncbi:MAG: hypothetical protein ABR976_07860 [Terracidiphilus sp.]|jgi:hypothetical protein
MEAESKGFSPQPRASGPSGLTLLLIVLITAVVTFALLFLAKNGSGNHGAFTTPRYLLPIILGIVLFLRLLPLLFDWTVGKIGLVQISAPEFEQRIRTRYQSETAQLAGLGFDQLFFVGDSTSIFRLLLIFPAIVVYDMHRGGVPMTVQNGTRLLTGNPVFIAKDKTAYAHPNSLGFTFHTRFQDGTILVSKNFGDASGYIPSIAGNSYPGATVSDTWTAHQKRMSELESAGKRVDRQTSFEAYREIVLKEQTRK